MRSIRGGRPPERMYIDAADDNDDQRMPPSAVMEGLISARAAISVSER